uniref:Secreted protein n=1 Tax=Arundo donax TaxID=35708 RepID=A0A0A9D7H5_ARUDO
MGMGSWRLRLHLSLISSSNWARAYPEPNPRVRVMGPDIAVGTSAHLRHLCVSSPPRPHLCWPSRRRGLSPATPASHGGGGAPPRAATVGVWVLASWWSSSSSWLSP